MRGLIDVVNSMLKDKYCSGGTSNDEARDAGALHVSDQPIMVYIYHMLSTDYEIALLAQIEHTKRSSRVPDVLHLGYIQYVVGR